jgi:translocation and assembly module TamB
MSAVTKHSRSRRVLGVLGVLGKVVGVSAVFVSATATAAVVHLDLPATRRLVATQMTGVLKSTFEGEIQIDRIGHVGLDGIEGVNVRIRDPEGIEVVHVDGVRVRVDSVQAARSALFGKGPIVVSVPAVSIDHADVNLDANAAKELRIAATFAPKTPSLPTDPNAPPGRGVVVEAPNVRLRHAWVHGTPPDALLVDADLSQLSGRAHLDPSIVVRAELERVSLIARALPRAVDPSGTASGKFLMPAKNGQGFDVQAFFDGAVGGIPTIVEGRLDDRQLDARVDARDAYGVSTNALVTEVAVRDPLTFHAEAHGDLPHIEGNAKLVLGRAVVDAAAIVDASTTTHVKGTVSARDVDVGAIVTGAPATQLGLDGKADIVIEGSQIRGEASVDTLAGTVDRQRVPPIAATAKAAGDRYELRARIHDPAMPTEVAVDVAPRDGRADAQVVNAEVRSRVPDLRRVPKVGSRVGGSARVDATARLFLPEKTIDEARVNVVVDRVMIQGLAVSRAFASARAHGSVEHAIIDGEVHARELSGAPVGVSSLDARARVEISENSVTIDAPSLEAARNEIRLVSASARRVRIQGDRLQVEQAEILGLGDPIHVDFVKDAREIRGSIDAPKIDLPLVVRLAGKENEIQIEKGTFGVQGDVAFRGGVAKAKIHADLRDLSMQNVSNGKATLDASIDDRDVDLAVDANIGRVGAVEIRTNHVVIDGRVDDPRAWKRVSGRVQLAGHVDLLRAALLAPRGALPVTDLRGELSVQGKVGRDAPDAPPEVQLHAHTNGLLVAGRSGPPERVGGITIEPPAPWRSSDVDLGVDVRNDGTSGLTMVAFRATDEHGVVAALDAKTILPYEQMMASGWTSERSRAELLDAPMSVTVVVPARQLDHLPAVVGVNNLHGLVDAKLDVTGTAHEPNVQLIARGRGVRTPEMPADINADADVRLAYDGKVANLDAKVGSGGKQLLDLASRVEIATRDLIDTIGDGAHIAAGAPKDLPWNASGRVKLASFPLESVPQIASRHVRGRISGELSLDDLHRDAKLKGRIDLDKLAIGRAHYPKGFVTVDAGGGKLAVKVRLDQEDGFLDGGVTTGLTWGADLAPALDDKQPLVASLDAKAFRAAALQPFVESAVPMLDGRIDANVRARTMPGTPGAQMQGGLSMRDGTVEVAALGEELRNFKASVAFSPDGTIRVTDVYARGTQGEVNADAQVKVDGMRIADATAHIRIPGRKALAVVVHGQPVGEIAGQINVKASQSADAKTTTMVVDIPKLAVDLPQVSKSGVQSLDENEHIHVGVYRGSRDPARSKGRRQGPTLPPAQANRGRRFVTLPLDENDLDPAETQAKDGGSHLDVDVRLGQIQIDRGNMLQVTLTGNPKVTIENGETKLRGQIQVSKGWIDVQGKRFTVENGTVTFDGESPPNPVVVVTAGWNAADGTRVYADFTGPVKTGKVTLRSEPPRPQNEIFALVLFGTADGANPQRPPPGKQADGTTKAAVGFGGGYVAQGLTEALDDLAGIQATARVDSTRANNPRPEVEIAISSKVSVGFAHVLGTPPITEPDKNLANVDYRFHRNWSLEATYGDRGTALLDAIWQRRY